MKHYSLCVFGVLIASVTSESKLVTQETVTVASLTSSTSGAEEKVSGNGCEFEDFSFVRTNVPDSLKDVADNEASLHGRHVLCYYVNGTNRFSIPNKIRFIVTGDHNQSLPDPSSWQTLPDDSQEINTDVSEDIWNFSFGSNLGGVLGSCVAYNSHSIGAFFKRNSLLESSQIWMDRWTGHSPLGFQTLGGDFSTVPFNSYCPSWDDLGPDRFNFAFESYDAEALPLDGQPVTSFNTRFYFPNLTHSENRLNYCIRAMSIREDYKLLIRRDTLDDRQGSGSTEVLFSNLPRSLDSSDCVPLPIQGAPGELVALMVDNHGDQRDSTDMEAFSLQPGLTSFGTQSWTRSEESVTLQVEVYTTSGACRSTFPFSFLLFLGCWSR